MLRILIVAPSWIGDTLLAQPLLRRLHDRLGNVVLEVLAPFQEVSFEILERLMESLDFLVENRSIEGHGLPPL